MILVDSSVWIDFFRGRETRETSYLKLIRTSKLLLTADLVLIEVLQGCRSQSDAALVEDELTAFDVLTISNEHVAVTAAQHYRSLRALGITIRKTIDTLIATRCILDNIELLYADRDFDPFVEHFALNPALLPRTGSH